MGKRLLNIISAIGVLTIMLAAVSCGESQKSGTSARMDYARLLTLENGDGYTIARIKNPWDTAHLMQTLILTEDISRTDLPEGTRVKVPLSKALVTTTVHCSLMREMGCVESIAGVCDADYITNSGLKARIKSGKIADCGSSMAPAIERIIALHPDAILISPYENMDMKKLTNTGIPLIQCADYMEATPLGRAEWIRFYGILTGRRAAADSMFNATRERYNTLKAKAENAEHTPSVLTDMRYGQIWYVPSVSSTIGQIYSDAHARNPFDDDRTTPGSLALSPEQVLVKARNADVWVIKAGQDVTRRTLDADNPVYKEFDAYRKGNIWTCNTMTTDFFDEVPFHPDYLLEDFIHIFHPELGIGGENRYYRKTK